VFAIFGPAERDFRLIVLDESRVEVCRGLAVAHEFLGLGGGIEAEQVRRHLIQDGAGFATGGRGVAVDEVKDRDMIATIEIDVVDHFVSRQRHGREGTRGSAVPCGNRSHDPIEQSIGGLSGRHLGEVDRRGIGSGCGASHLWERRTERLGRSSSRNEEERYKSGGDDRATNVEDSAVRRGGRRAGCGLGRRPANVAEAATRRYSIVAANALARRTGFE
jgi:hypothetical protein